MEQDLQKIIKTYDATAREYSEEVLGEHDKKPMDQEILARFAREIEAGGKVWDLGCGPGQTVEYLDRLGVRAEGIDLSPQTVKQAQKNFPRLQFRTGNMLNLDIPSGSAVAVLSFYSIVHLTSDQVRQAFREIYRILHPGGIFLLAFHIGEETLHLDEFKGKPIDVDFMLFSTEFISASLQDAGFTRLELSERDPIPDVEYDNRRSYVFARKPA